MKPHNTLVIHYLFILFILLSFAPLALFLHSQLPMILAIALLTMIALLLAFWIVKTLLAPLFLVSHKLDILLKETLHELNIPVSTINANAAMLKKRLEDPKLLRQTERIIEASKHLLQMHASLEYAIKKEFHAPPSTPIDLKSFLEERIDHYKTLYPQVSFVTQLEPTFISIDTHGLQKTIDNLISNSVKYALTQPVITLTLASFQLAITDNGKGIDESQLLRIFERYYQEQATHEGYGIGLSIVKSFCDAQNVKLSISSIPNVFTKVVLNFVKLKSNEE